MELKDTIALMTSADYQKRFRAEFEQTSIRYEKLQAMIAQYKAGTLDFVPKCSVELLERQALYMHNYLAVLEERAEIEGVDLSGRDCKTCKHYNERKDFLFRCEAAHSDTQTLDCYQPREPEDEDKPGYITAYVPRKTK